MAKATKKRKRKPISVGQTAEGFVIGVDPNPVAPPSKKELDRMRQREVIRKNPTGTI